MKEKCPECPKVFEALNERELKLQVAIHKITQHPDKYQIKEVKQKDAKKTSKKD